VNGSLGGLAAANSADSTCLTLRYGIEVLLNK
jgi:hypothetical protein